MRKLASLLLSLCVMTGCMHSSHDAQLAAADSLLLTAPDSALHCLQQRSVPSSTADRMYYYLLLADASNKCYAVLPSDSIMHSVADYYDRHGTPNEQVRAHYLLGCTYRDMGEAPQALDCYHTALDRADTTAADCNHRLLMSVYGQMAELFHRQNLPQDEIEADKHYGDLALRVKDTLLYIRNVELMAKPYELLGDTAKLIELLENASELYKKHGYPQLALSANAALAYLCVQRNQMFKAEELLREYEQHSNLFDSASNIERSREAYYNVKGHYFLKVVQLDSAEHYMRRLLFTEYQQQAYRGLLLTYQRQNRPDSVSKYIMLYDAATDSLLNRNSADAVHRMQAMYNYHRYEKKAADEQQKTVRLKWLFTFVLCAVFLIAGIVSYVLHNQKKRRTEKVAQLYLSYRKAVVAYHEKQEELRLLSDNKKNYVLQKEKEIQQLRATIDIYKEKLRPQEKEDHIDDLRSSELVKKFHEKTRLVKDLPTKKEWHNLFRLFKKNMPAEYVTCIELGQLARMEQQTYILILLDFSDSECMILQNTSAQSLSNTKARINKKLFKDNSSSSLRSNLSHLISKV